MKPLTQKRIAKEILIFFSSLVSIIIIVCIIWMTNLWTNYRKTKTLETNISLLTIKRDSLKSTFPVALSFEEIIECKLPDNFYKEEQINSTQKNISVKNLKYLYYLLRNYNYQFNFEVAAILIPNVKPRFMPYEAFERDIKFEFTVDSENKPELKKIYEFLKTKNCITISFSQFVFNLEGFPEPPASNLWSKYNKTNQQIELLKNDLQKVQNKKYSRIEIEELTKWIGMILLIIIYPIRLIVNTLLWAIQIVRKN